MWAFETWENIKTLCPYYDLCCVGERTTLFHVVLAFLINSAISTLSKSLEGLKKRLIKEVTRSNLMMMRMINCLYGMVDGWKAFSLISSRDQCQRSSPSRISDTPLVGFEPMQNLSSGLVEWSCAVVITTTPL